MCVPCLSSRTQGDLQRYDVTVRLCGQSAPIFLWAKFSRHGIRIVQPPVCNGGKNDTWKSQESILSVQRRLEYIHFRHRKGISKAAHICSKKSPPNQRSSPLQADDCKRRVVSAKWSFRRFPAWLTVIRVNECDYQLFARIFGNKSLVRVSDVGILQP